MVGERDRAVRAAGNVTAVAAQDELRIATAIQEEDDLLARGNSVPYLLDEMAAEEGFMLAQLFPHVDKRDGWKRAVFDAFRHFKQSYGVRCWVLGVGVLRGVECF